MSLRITAGLILLQSASAQAAPSFTLRSEDPQQTNSALERQHRTGIAFLARDGSTLLFYSGLEAVFLESPLSTWRLELGARGGIQVGLGHDDLARCCNLDTQDGYVGILARFIGERWALESEFVHHVGHAGADGRFSEHPKVWMDYMILRASRVLGTRWRLHAAIAGFLSDAHRDRTWFGRAGLVATFDPIRVEGVWRMSHDHAAESARLKVSLWPVQNRYGWRAVPYLLLHHGEHFLTVRREERITELLVGFELSLEPNADGRAGHARSTRQQNGVCLPRMIDRIPPTVGPLPSAEMRTPVE